MDQILLSTPWFTFTQANLLEFFFVGLSVIGQEFIVRRNRRGFFFFIAGNLVAVVMFSIMGRWMSVLLYLYFIAKSMQAIRHWRVLEDEDEGEGEGEGESSDSVKSGSSPAAGLPRLGLPSLHDRTAKLFS